MERIVYRKTLDVHKNGIQFTLQGFETNDNMARSIEIGLMSSGDTIDLPMEQITALMYVTTPNDSEPSIHQCTIKDNKIIYDVLPIVAEGITEMQIKLIETSLEGAKSVLATPRFAVEVTKGNIDDSGATQTTTFTALEDALAKAKGVYDARFLRMEIDSECMFRVYYADGTTYESDALKELYLKGESLMAQSFARGGTGVRVGEDTDNAMYYSNVSKSAAIQSNDALEQSEVLLEESRKHGVYTAFSVDFETGEVKYISPLYKFNIDKESGELNAIGKTFTPEETIDLVVTEWLNNKSSSIDASIEKLSDLCGAKHVKRISNIVMMDVGGYIDVPVLENVGSESVQIKEISAYALILDEINSTHTYHYQQLSDIYAYWNYEQETTMYVRILTPSEQFAGAEATITIKYDLRGD